VTQFVLSSVNCVVACLKTERAETLGERTIALFITSLSSVQRFSTRRIVRIAKPYSFEWFLWSLIPSSCYSMGFINRISLSSTLNNHTLQPSTLILYTTT